MTTLQQLPAAASARQCAACASRRAPRRAYSAAAAELSGPCERVKRISDGNCGVRLIFLCREGVSREDHLVRSLVRVRVAQGTRISLRRAIFSWCQSRVSKGCWPCCCCCCCCWPAWLLSGQTRCLPSLSG